MLHSKCQFSSLRLSQLCMIVSGQSSFNLCIKFILQEFSVSRVCVEGKYMVEVRLFGYENPTGTCRECDFNTGTISCCDDCNRASNCGQEGRRSDSYFIYCLRPDGIVGLGCSTYETETSTVNTDDGPLDFSQSTVLGLPNPLQLPINDSIVSSTTNVSN